MSGEEGSHPPSDDIGWKFGIPISGSRHKLKCKFCGREINGGITRLKQHLAAKKGQVAPCQSVSADVRTLMMKHLEGNLEKKMDKRKQREEVIEQIRASQRDQDNPYDLSDDDNSDDPDMAYARKESMRLHREEEDRERYRRDAGNRYETGSNSGVGESTRRGSTTTRIANMFRRSSTVRESSSKKSWIDSSLPEARLAEIDVDLHRSKAPKQQKISTRVIKGLRKKLGVAVSQFVLYTHLPTNVVNSPWLEPMLDVAREVGKGVKVPTPYEVTEVFLPREYEELRKWIESHKPNWEERGVTIMCDGWSGPTRKHIINFLIYSNRGTVFHKSVDATDVVSRTADYYFGLMDKVVDEIGEKYIVQIVTDNEPAIKAAGKKLMLKRPNLYWTGCAAHCLDLILKDIGEKTNVLTVLDDARRISRFIYNSSWVIDFMKRFTEGKELLRPGITRFATNFIMLESIVRYKNALQNMFNCDEWKSKRWAKEDCGKKVRKIVNDNGFWIKASEILKVQEPLVRVLRLVDGDEKPTMGFVYEAMDKAKMAIEKNCRYYKKYWKMIDKRWQFQLHHDLHAAGYFLNPQFQYGGKLSDHREVMEGVQKVIQRLEPNIDKQIQAINQIMMFRDKEHSFGTVLAQRAVTRTNPGVKGVYSSRTIGGASKFICQYTSYLNLRKQIDFLTNLTAFAKKHSLGRAGFMALAECISSAVSGFKVCNDNDLGRRDDAFPDMVEVESAPVSSSHNAKADLLDLLRYIIEISKQHFNHKYRRQVCERILEAATSVMSVLDVPLEILLHFISSLPREFTDSAGSLRVKIQGWLLDCDQGHFISNSCETNVPFLKGLADLPGKFIRPPHSMDALIFCDDEDLEAWEYEAKRWARVFFLVIKDEKHLDPILTFIQNHVIDICKETSHLDWLPVKFLILSLSLVQELKVTLGITADCGIKGSAILLKPSFPKRLGCSTKASFLIEKLSELFLSVLGELVSFAELSCSIFWSKIVKEDTVLPGSIRGKLGGPSRRRLSSSSTSIVLQAIVSSRSVASISSWCAQLGDDVFLDSAVTFLWKLSWKIISIPPCSSETNGEISLAAYEMLAYVLKALVSMFSPLALNLVMEGDESFPSRADGKPLLDSFVQIFIEHINILIEGGNLARTRRAILINWKWICVESLLSIPKVAFENGVHAESCQSFFSDATVRWIFDDLVDGLENAGEDSVLPMLRSIRLIMDLFTSGSTVLPVSSHDGLDAQMMWKLVKSSWILHVSCNKRRVAPIAALLSSVLHHSVFRDEGMHEIDNSPGPLKWFVEKILEKCTKSPRTIRLTALHLTGLWLAYPSTIKYYMNELKLLTMYGSVAFDEDFEAELSDNPEARNEVSMLARSPDSELTEEFINTELYARVSVAVLFYKLADLANMGKSMNGSGNSSVSLESGKMFLLELLDSAVQEKDLSKELYKKFSAIHRRKVRVWQMICILSRFIEQDIVEKVTCCLNVSLYRNNLPSVRQYLETFAIYMYLKFPSSVGEQLVPILRNYDMRTQALSSYVFIAANVILHAAEAIQSQNLHELLPPIIPFLTSHHHTLRCFSQLLVYKVLCKLLPAYNSNSSSPMSLERRCFDNLKSYLADNPDCARLRASMESYLDAFDPEKSITPAGIFTSRVEDVDFECVPTSLMERVIFFLNEAREDLRFSMARDASTVKNESLRIQEVSSNGEESVTQLPEDMLLDFQKKITFSKYANQDSGTTLLLGNNNTPKSLTDLEKEDQLLDQFLQARSVAIEESRASRQQFIIVASLLDRIPNLAGLARTCEVFKATGLTIADKSILHDKQFQLISVTAEKWVPIIEVPVSSLQVFLEKKKKEGFAIMGLEQTANSIPLDQYTFPQKTVMILGREKEGIPVEVIHILDACLEIPQLGVVRSLNVHVSGAIALWEYTRQQRTSLNKLSSS